MGTGMAFPWEVISTAKLDSGEIVEDLKLGLDLTLAGHPPLFCPSACVTSKFASSVGGSEAQRKRWEHGHLDTIFRNAPSLIMAAIVRRDRELLAIAIDLAIPPLSLLGILVMGVFGLSLLNTIIVTPSVALAISSGNVLALGIAIVLAWTKCGRDVVPPNAVLLLPSYALRKVSLYCQFMLGRIESQWTRTDRSQ